MKNDMKETESHRDIARLIRLKRYEKPEEGYAARLLCALRVRLTEEEHARSSALQRGFFAWPAVRLAAAAVAVLLIACGALWFAYPPAAGPMTAESEPTEAEIEEILLAATNKSFIHDTPRGAGGGFHAAPAGARP